MKIKILNLPSLNSYQNTFYNKRKSINSYTYADSFEPGNILPNINKQVLVDSKIINQNQNLEEYFGSISKNIFGNNKSKSKEFKKMLINGDVGLSSSVLRNTANPASAIGLKIDENQNQNDIYNKLTEVIFSNRGFGINFSDYSNPIDSVRGINLHLWHIESNAKRPPAGIALLNINNKDILKFINLKNNRNYAKWCMDLSVVVPLDFLEKVDNNKDITLSDGSTMNSQVIYNNLLNSMLLSGEPGVIFSDNPEYICDACGAMELKPNECLTISHINLANFAENNHVDFLKLKKTAKMLSSVMKNINGNSCIGVVGFQELLDNLNIKYGTNKANSVLEKCLETISNEAHKKKIKTAISPTGTVSRYLKVTPNIQPKNYNDIDYNKQLQTLATAQKHIDCNISNTIILDKKATTDDVDKIFRFANKNHIKGFTVFKPQNDL